ncbi:HTH-type transcriptional regulator GltC [mine drainage metagenome]|uniref:HTH-type transcriptional regulator GltC n=1 Tax=mine drainage metagenome TaxID=410659 RepID=A0A1J5S8S3_9ZZZZ
MELRHLRYFVAVAEEENVSRAALRLHVSQPALSRQVRDLEDELGFALLHRSAKSVRLTDAGRTFLGESRAVLKRADDAVAAAMAVATGRTGELHIGYAPTPTSRLLPPALRAFQAETPEVRVKLHDLSTEEMVRALRERTVHLALLVKPGRALLRGLKFVSILTDPVRIAVPPGHPWARLRKVPFERLLSEPLVVYSRKDFPEYHEFLDGLFAQHKRTPVVASEHESGASLVAAVEAGYGLALASRSLACSIGARLKLIPVAPEPEPLVIGAAWLAEGLPPVGERFLRCAKDAAKAV